MSDWVIKYTCGSCKEYEYAGENYKGYCNYYRCYYFPDDSCNHWEESEYVSSPSGGCYLTTACVEYYGLPDDCMELTTLRHFRDSYMAETAEGRLDIAEYYKTAPKIVEIINNESDKDSIYKKLYTETILPCVELINDEKFSEAHEMYKGMVKELQERFL